MGEETSNWVGGTLSLGIEDKHIEALSLHSSATMKTSRLSVLLRQAGPAHLRLQSAHHLTRSHAVQRRALSAAAGSNAIRDLLQVSSEVSDAIAKNKPVVALESTIYTHGALGKDLAREHEDLVRSTGGIPAIIAIVDGVPKVGVSTDEIIRMIEEEGTVKASRRDISYLVGMVSLPSFAHKVVFQQLTTSLGHCRTQDPRWHNHCRHYAAG